jgi:hypothetical protein
MIAAFMASAIFSNDSRVFICGQLLLEGPASHERRSFVRRRPAGPDPRKCEGPVLIDHVLDVIELVERVELGVASLLVGMVGSAETHPAGCPRALLVVTTSRQPTDPDSRPTMEWERKRAARSTRKHASVALGLFVREGRAVLTDSGDLAYGGRPAHAAGSPIAIRFLAYLQEEIESMLPRLDG